MVYPLIMAAALGIGDGVMMTQINALLGMLFKHDMVRFFKFFLESMSSANSLNNMSL